MRLTLPQPLSVQHRPAAGAGSPGAAPTCTSSTGVSSARLPLGSAAAPPRSPAGRVNLLTSRGCVFLELNDEAATCCSSPAAHLNDLRSQTKACSGEM
ncbi:unnamed protein product [Caretta caretta]